MLDSLLFAELRSCGARSIDFLPRDYIISGHIRRYLLSCHVEGKTPKTIRTYCDVLVGLAKFLAENKLPSAPENLTADDVRFFLSLWHKGNVSSSTRHLYYRTIKTFFNWLVREGQIRESPMAKMKPPKLESKVVQPYTPEDIGRILSLCETPGFSNARNRAIILLFFDTGLRLSELANIRLDDINTKTQLIKVMGKGSKERYVKYGRITSMGLMMYLSLRDDKYPELWLTQDKRPMTIYGVKEVVVRLVERAKVSEGKRGPHRFRHTAAINFLRNGGGQFNLQSLLGHSTLEMTRRYVSALGTEDMVKAHLTASPADNMFGKKKP